MFAFDEMQRKPTKEDLRDAINRTTEDLIEKDLRLLFCGINPGLYSGATGLHFARPGNRFWKALHLSGLTPRQLDPSEEADLLEMGIGITSFCGRTTARAEELTDREYREGGSALIKKVEHYRPSVVAVLGLGAFQKAYGVTKAVVGQQAKKLAGAELWLLPNPSGLNAHYQLNDFVRLFAELKDSMQK